MDWFSRKIVRDCFVENENNENPQRDTSRNLLGISKTNVQRTLEINDYRPFKFLPVQELPEEDRHSLLHIRWHSFDEPYFENNIFKIIILFTGETIFNTADIFNRKNTRYWCNWN